jgi:hypothetical protein
VGEDLTARAKQTEDAATEIPMTTVLDNPSRGAGLRVVRWQPWHTAAVVAVTAFFVWMAVWLPFGVYSSWIIAMLALAAFTLVVGRGLTGVWKGAFVDDRLRMSLSRLQMLTWTIVIVAALGTMAIARAQTDPVTAMDIAVPPTVWALLGISMTSLIGSPLIKNAKKSSPAAETPDRESARGAARAARADRIELEGQVVKNTSIDDATFADLFMGEYVDTFAMLDIAKIQMFFFTVLLVLAYAIAVGRTLRTDPSLASLPDVGEGMLPILGISHAGYLLSKAVTKP